MKKLLFALLLTPVLATAQLRDSVRIKTDIYEVIYSEKLESPRWVKYTVLCPNGTASRAGMDFYTNDSVKTSSNEDYVKNEWDKGHMAPAADFNCDKVMLYKTFSYLNCALQNQYLNRGVWRMLELQEREYAKQEPTVVTIEATFSKTSYKLPTGATVPDGFFKIIYLEKSGKTIKFYFPNVTPTKEKYTDYQLSK
jgi:endonuclease G